MNNFHHFIADKVECAIGREFMHRDMKCGKCQCGRSHKMSLYYRELSNGEDKIPLKLCEPDILVIQQDRLIGILEVDDLNISPEQAIGKLMASSLAKCYIPSSKYRPCYYLNDTTFIQVILLDHTKKKREPKKLKERHIKKWPKLRSEMEGRISVKCSRITRYELFLFSYYGTGKYIEEKEGAKDQFDEVICDLRCRIQRDLGA